MRYAAMAMAVAMAAVFMVGCGSRRQPAPVEPVMASPSCPVQAVPVRNWLQAARAGDEDLLKTVFADRVRPILDAAGWDRVLRTYRDLWDAALGPDYDVERLSFTYTGDGRWGHVLVDSATGTLPPIRVVNDGGVWRVFEDGLGPVDGR